MANVTRCGRGGGGIHPEPLVRRPMAGAADVRTRAFLPARDGFGEASECSTWNICNAIAQETLDCGEQPGMRDSRGVKMFHMEHPAVCRRVIGGRELRETAAICARLALRFGTVSGCAGDQRRRVRARIEPAASRPTEVGSGTAVMRTVKKSLPPVVGEAHVQVNSPGSKSKPATVVSR